MRRSLMLTPLLAAAVAAPAAAQEPAAGTPEISGFIACVAEPRPPEELVAFWFGPDDAPAATPTPSEPVASEAALPTGEAVDRQTVAEVNAVAVGVIACLDQGQLARAFALMTDDLVAQFGPNLANPAEDTAAEVQALLEAQIAAGAAATPEAAATPAPVVLRDVRRTGENRVGGVFEQEGGRVFLAFERIDDQWLLAEIVGITPGSPDSAGAAQATPAP